MQPDLILFHNRWTHGEWWTDWMKPWAVWMYCQTSQSPGNNLRELIRATINSTTSLRAASPAKTSWSRASTHWTKGHHWEGDWTDTLGKPNSHCTQGQRQDLPMRRHKASKHSGEVRTPCHSNRWWHHRWGCWVKVPSKLDLNSGYHHHKLTHESIPITTFSPHMGLDRYKRLIFGHIINSKSVPTHDPTCHHRHTRNAEH